MPVPLPMPWGGTLLTVARMSPWGLCSPGMDQRRGGGGGGGRTEGEGRQRTRGGEEGTQPDRGAGGGDGAEAQKKEDLRTHQVEIKSLLRKEIINRYYYKQVVIESSFTYDQYLLTADSILNNSDKYQKILQGQQ